MFDRSSLRRAPCLPLAALAALLIMWTSTLVCAQSEEEKHIALLKSDASFFDKAKACQRLAVVGTAKAVPALAGLLGDEKLAHYARFGLETIPDASVDAALREAMGKLQGKLLVGLINSIGARGDTKALAGLGKLLDAPDREVARAAAAALGRIGTTAAARTLGRELPSARGAYRADVVQASLACAEALLARGKRAEAVALYDTVRRLELPKHLEMAATRGAILARAADGVPLLAEKLRGEDYALFAMALGVAREMTQAGVTPALVAGLVTLPAQRQALVLRALADRGDAAALPAVIKAARSSTAAVRVAALRALKSVGNATAVPVLLEAAARPEGDEPQAALAALESLRGEDVDDAIVAMLGGGEKQLRPVVIELVGRRRIASAVPSLRKALGEGDAQVRLAAIRALGRTIGLDELPVLVGRLAAPGAPEETAAAQEALKIASRRMPDRDACAEKLLASISRVPVEAKCHVLEVFSAVGGTRALEVVAAHARDPHEPVRDTAARVLGEWSSEEAVPELLELARKARDRKDKIRTLRAFRDITRRLGFPKERRIGFCRDAMGIARSEGERRLVLEALAGIPAVETLPLLSAYLEIPALKEEASAALVEICERIGRSHPKATAEAMEKVLQATEKKDMAKRAEKLLRQSGRKKA